MSIKNANTNLAPKDLADSFLRAMIDTFGETNFLPMFDTLESVMRTLKETVAENLIRERQIARDRVEVAETSAASMMSLFVHFKTSFHGDLEDILNPKEIMAPTSKGK